MGMWLLVYLVLDVLAEILLFILKISYIKMM